MLSKVSASKRASADGTTTFVQAKGDFVTADRRPYRNVYVFRFDWRAGTIVSWGEYANPITIIRTFPACTATWRTESSTRTR